MRIPPLRDSQRRLFVAPQWTQIRLNFLTREQLDRCDFRRSHSIPATTTGCATTPLSLCAMMYQNSFVRRTFHSGFDRTVCASDCHVETSHLLFDVSQYDQYADSLRVWRPLAV